VSNPNGVGACLRLKFGERLGPAREVQAGAGYWSHNSVVQVMATPEPPTHVWVRWPGGKTTTSEIPAGAKEIAVDQTGALKLLK
jgi:phage gp37-like protein